MSSRPRYVVFLSLVLLAIAMSVGLGVRHSSGSQKAKRALDPGHPVTESSQNHPRKPNRLISEKSPYLLQHALNPVNWYPWGEEAFGKASRENKPIFLSIGYSTCHWCHVMEHESFSNLKIASVMNQYFVSIKVDREERPDVDQVYMKFVQATTGSGGWPMSVFLTPELKPFFGGTYFPPEGGRGRPGFRTLLLEIAKAWDNDRRNIVAAANKITDRLKESGDLSADGDLKLEDDLLTRTYDWYETSYDSARGGFGSAPKFPRPVNFNFLLRHYSRTGRRRALEMTTHTLRSMAGGGVYDHLGGGFHRYSTDQNWFLPHFEKMLYDQAQLAISYLEVYQITQESLFADVASGIFHYVLRDMTGTEGGFYSAEDADSPLEHHLEEQAEGAFYVWTHHEMEQLLETDSAIFNHHYGIKADGNVERDAFGEFKGKNILHVSSTPAQTAKRFEKSVSEIKDILALSREKLFQVRVERPRPGLDDKVLTAWNGLMISALARGYQVLQKKPYLQAAEAAAQFISTTLYEPEDRRLKRRYRNRDIAVDGMMSDYAFLIQGLLDLYEASLEGRWLLWAMDLTETQNRLFWDQTKGGFYSTTGKDPSILIRMKEDYDGAKPSPNSVAVLNLLRLSQMTGNEQWREMAERSIRAFGKRLKTAPYTMPQMMAAVHFLMDKPKQILIAGQQDSSDTRAILRTIHRRFIPNKIILLADDGEVHKRLATELTVLKHLDQIDGKATAYVCENYICQLPTNQLAVLDSLLEQ